MNELVAIAVIVAAVSGQPTARVDREGVRLRAHFSLVDHELRSRDVSHLTPAQLRARAEHIARLQAYAAAGVFPMNTRHPGAYVPYFVDERGTRCAMAYLIEQSGAGDFVARVAARLNHATIADIARDPDLGAPLLAWLEANGLSQDEAARIQPAYEGPGCCTVDEPEPVPTGYKVGSGATILTGLTTVALNASLVQLGLSRRVSGWVGVGVGAAGLALGASALDKGDEFSTWRTLNGGVGAFAVGLGLYALLSRPAAVPTTTARREARLTASPWLARDGGSGVALSVRF